MPFDPNQSIAQKTRFTPAERGVLVEKAEAMKVSLDALIKQAKEGDPQGLVMSMIPCQQEWQDMQTMISTKLERAIYDNILGAVSDHYEG